jgi:hypothetical protein
VRCCKLGIDIHFLHSANLFDFVVYNKNICKDVDSNPNFMWNWNFICLNNSINEAFLLKHKEKWFHDKFFYQYISLNPSISLKFLFSCQVPLSYIATNPNVNEKNFHIYFSKEIVNNSEEIQNALTENECISIDFILTHPEYNRKRYFEA